MKKITLILAFIGMISLNSCTVNEVQDNVDNDTIAEVFEVTTSFNLNNNFKRLVTFNPPIYNSDAVLVYRLSGVSNGTDIWKLLPETFYFNDGTLDYKFDFNYTKYDVELNMEGFELWNLPLQFTSNQVFRIVVVPGYFAKGAASIDYNDYNATLNAFGYTDAKIIKLE